MIYLVTHTRGPAGGRGRGSNERQALARRASRRLQVMSAPPK